MPNNEPKQEVRKHIVDLYFEYKEELRKWNERAKQYGGNQEPTLEGFMHWMNRNYIGEL